jgi:NADH:ubiquinone oxidoreductase subunit 6 (subunit J)
LAKPETLTVNWIGLVRSLQAEIIGLVGALLLILAIWLVVRSIIMRSATGVAAQARLRAWSNRGACVLALVIVGGMLWHVMTVVAVNRLPRQDVDGSPVYERMDAITKK